MESFLSGLETGVGVDIILWFQSWRLDAISDLFLPFHYAGKELFFLVLLTIVYWTVSKPVGRRLAIILLVSAWLNAFCKEYWKRPRPFQVTSRVEPAFMETGYGLPSGHTQTATSVACYFMAEAKKRWAFVLLFLYIFLMGISRMLHGVHFPQDVVLGWIVGILLVVVILKVESRIKPWLTDITASRVVIVTAAATAIMLGLVSLTVPNSHGMASMITPIAVLAGVIPGFFIESQKVTFSVQGGIGQRCLRYLVGISTALLIKEGFKPLLGVFFDGSLLMEAVTRFVRYFAVGLWVAAGAPWLFVKLKLAVPEEVNQIKPHTAAG